MGADTCSFPKISEPQNTMGTSDISKKKTNVPAMVVYFFAFNSRYFFAKYPNSFLSLPMTISMRHPKPFHTIVNGKRGQKPTFTPSIFPHPYKKTRWRKFATPFFCKFNQRPCARKLNRLSRIADCNNPESNWKSPPRRRIFQNNRNPYRP